MSNFIRGTVTFLGMFAVLAGFLSLNAAFYAGLL